MIRHQYFQKHKLLGNNHFSRDEILISKITQGREGRQVGGSGGISLIPLRFSLRSLCNDDGDGDCDGNENGTKSDRFRLTIKKTTLLVHHAFLYISQPSLHDYNLKVSPFHVLLRTGTQDNNFLFLFLDFDTVVQNPTPKKFASI